MNGRSSLSNRLSLSTTNLSNPIADSTHINGSSVAIKFPWGGKLSTSTTPSNLTVQKGAPMVTMSPINKIDPRVYIDVQSKGLASRIVKYHENSSKLNRSFSTGNLYNKPGQYPVVHLKKKELTYKGPRNQNVSMVRIAPPDKSVFQANTRSSILRTGSVVPTVSLQKNNDQISGENRPILHPAGNDIAPTRSVLDALREISRKRINSDELDCCDNIKKYCKETDELKGNPRLEQPYSTTSMSKRQREGPSSPNSKIKVSPEQVSKKRICSRNNDVTSSLSSSLMMITPKRKFDDLHTGKGSEKYTKSDSPTPPRSKQQCYDSNYVPLEKIGTILSGEITPLPPTPAIEPIKLKENSNSLSEPSFPVGNEKPKPKLTLFNKNYDTSVTNIVHNSDSKFEDNDISGIPFVKPKSNSHLSSGINPIIERTKKSKLALMLSGLSGELNEDETDNIIKEPVCNNEAIQQNPTSIVSKPIGLATSTTSASISFETKTTTSTATIPAITQVSNKDQNTTQATSVTDSTSESVAVTNPVALQLMPPSTQSVAPSLTATNMTTTAAKGFSLTGVVNKIQSTDAKPGLTFGFQDTSPIQTNVSPQLSTTVPASTTAIISSQSTPTFSFGKTTGSVTSVNTLLQFSSPSENSKNTVIQAFGFPKTPQSSASTVFATTSAESIGTSNNTQPKSNNILANPTTLKSTFQAAVTSAPISTTPGITISNTVNNQFGLLSTPQQSSSGYNSINANTNIATANSDITAENVEPASNLFINNSSIGGFSFKPTNQSSSPIKSNSNVPFPSNTNQNLPITTSGFSCNKSTSNKGGFSFGTSIPVSSSSMTVIPSLNGSALGGNNSKQSSGFSLGGNNSKQSSGFSLSNNTSGSNSQNVSTKPFGFGAGACTQQTAATTSSSFTESTIQNKLNPFSLGGHQATTSASIFGANNTENNPSSTFVFRSPQNQTSTSGAFSPAPNTFATAAASSNTRFGTQAITPNVVGFGKPVTINSNSAFGTQPTISNSTFGVAADTISNSTFGSPVITTNSTFGAPNTISNSTFGASVITPNPTFGSPAITTNSTFGASNTISNSAFTTPRTTATSIFGQAATIAPSFGIPTITSSLSFSSGAENKPGAFVFGGATNNIPDVNKSFSFSGNTSGTAVPSQGFALNASSTAKETNNMFGSSVNPSKTFTFGATTNNNNDKHVFGETLNLNSNSTTASPFGASSSNQTKGFNFTPASNSSATPNLFGTTNDNQSDKPFAFGSNQIGANNNNNSQNFAFRGGASTGTPFAFSAQSAPPTGSMSFNAQSAPPTGSMPFNAQPIPPTGSMSDVNKSFNFGGQSHQIGSQQSAFAVSITPQYNFSAGSNNNTANSTTNNAFNKAPTSSSTTTAGDRPIRIATRRLAK